MNKRRDSFPEHFNSAEEAGPFWDSHSAADYRTEMEEEEMKFEAMEADYEGALSGITR
ncbi:MAG: hypothetical protein KAT65_28670 [Methanophagales archaeon]|nr:hypothetical protein [Methanophagales archaeon]